MDPVSRILAERERSRPRLLPFAMIAVFLHASAVAAVFLASRHAAARPAQLPSVSVKIVRPERPAPRRSSGAPPRPTTPPKVATPEPEPEPETVPTPPTKQAPTTRQASDDAMAAPEREATPRPTPVSEPAGTGSGLSIGGDNGRRIPGIPSDFHFAYYVQRMLALIEARWYKPAAPAGTKALVRFTIDREGRLSRIELESSSGNPSFDRAALRALYAANPLPPLPPAYAKPSLTVHLTFSE